MKSKLDRLCRALLAGALGAALLAGCGGGGLVQTFSASRVIAFGDESSVIDDFQGDANGRKYSVNATQSATDATLACKLNPLWIQVVANSYGLVFPQCNPQPGAVPTPVSRIRAVPFAKVDDIAAQIDAQQAESAFTSSDLVTLLAGANDILAQYAQYPAVGEEQLAAQLDAAGVTLGLQVNRVADTGAKVLIATVFDLGLTPYGQAQKADNADTDRAALLSRLTTRFNTSLRKTIYNDGRKVGLVLDDDYFRVAAGNPESLNYVDVSTPVCDLGQSKLSPPSILDCTTLTLIPTGNGNTYLWADATHLSAGGQNALGTLAAERASNNPF